MDVDGRPYRTIWLDPDDPTRVRVIDQRRLPFELVVAPIDTVDAMVTAIADMWVRGAGLIGAAAGFGMYLAAVEGQDLEGAAARLCGSRPTAVNLAHAVGRQLTAAARLSGDGRTRPGDADVVECLRSEALAIADEDAEACRRIGEHGLPLIAKTHESTGRPVQVLTHCNAGWLAFVDHGTATAPIYAAHDAGIPMHVWVDETRPRNQGSRLTAWELGQHGVPHTVIVDNAGGHLMQEGRVDLVLTGSDRTTRAGDVVNKIGTYLKALAARDNGVPFHVALPSSTLDWSMGDSPAIPIEERAGTEVTRISGARTVGEGGSPGVDRTPDAVPDAVRRADATTAEVAPEITVALTPTGTPAANPSFDVTPARLVTGLITERGLCAATESGLAALFPELSRSGT